MRIKNKNSSRVHHSLIYIFVIHLSKTYLTQNFYINIKRNGLKCSIWEYVQRIANTYVRMIPCGLRFYNLTLEHKPDGQQQHSIEIFEHFNLRSYLWNDARNWWNHTEFYKIARKYIHIYENFNLKIVQSIKVFAGIAPT